MRHLRRHLPNLKALRTFEAVAHHRSFTKAAAELAVSQGAVSHQIKLLESALGLPLLVRSAKGVGVTVEGALLKEVCGRAFDDIGEVASFIRRNRETQILKVRAGPFFAMKVVVPRISGFLTQNPGLQFHLNNSDADPGAPAGEDAQISYCVHPPAGSYWIEVLRERLVPVCSPALSASAARPADIIGRPGIARLHYRDVGDWRDWLGRHGLAEREAKANLFFDDQHTLLAAVRGGQGVGLADRALIQDEVERGRICVVSESYSQPAASYKFICARERLMPRSPLERFRDWLVGEIAELQKKPERASPPRPA